MSKMIRILSLLGCVCFLGLPLLAQVNTGRILGTVTDQTGGVIAGATVTVTNTQTGVARNLVTDGAGEYNAPNLLPGTYTVRATSTGFQAFERQNITLEIGQDARIDAQLSPGKITQTVEVSAAAPLLDTTSAVVSGTLSTQTILDLPLNGRNFEDLLPLRPGVVQTPGGGSLTTSTNGLPPQWNNYFIEGLDNNEPFTGQSVTNTTLPFGDAASLLPVDSIQELNVETNAPAEFGRRPGAVINVGLKSGTNNIHGSAFAFGRDGAWDATDFANPPATFKPTVQLEQWGGTAGGPIVKNKLFFFGGFERQSVSVGNAFPMNQPTTLNTGDPSVSIPAAESDLATHGILVSPTSVNLLKLFAPNNGPTSAITLGFPNVYGINNAVGKVDYHPSDHHTITGSYFFGRGHAVGEDNAFTQQTFETIGDMRAQFLSTSWTWTPNSIWVNDFRVGWNHYARTTNVGDYQTPSSTYGFNSGITNSQVLGLPQINFANFDSLGGDVNSPKTYGPSSDYDVVDHVSFLRGKHAFKFGGEVFYYHMYYDAVADGRGAINFQNGGNAFKGSSSLEDFLAGDADNPTGLQLLAGNPARTFTDKDFSGFFEDSWRATSRLTVNLGLRYEYYTPLNEINNLIANWSPTVGFEQQGVNIKHPYNADPKDLSPRVGIAWDVTGKGTTVVRLGGGLYYTEAVASEYVGNIGLPSRASGISNIPTAYSLVMPSGTTQAPLLSVAAGGIGTATVTIPGTALNWNQTGGGTVYPASAISGFVCGNGIKPNPSPCSILATSANLPAPRVASWNLGIQHALTPTLSVEADYIGNHGYFLPADRDLNQINPTSPAEIACGHCESITDLPYYSQFPYLAYINWIDDTDHSNYDALQATLTARNYHNLSFIAGYTYSHALTNEVGSAGYGLKNPEDSNNPQLDYGPTGFDIRHHFSFTPTYNIPGKKSPLQLLEGWSVQSAVLINTGFHWGVSDKTDHSKTKEQGDRWDFFGNPHDFASTNTAIPFYGSVATMPAVCLQEAAALGTTTTALPKYGCYAQGGSVMIAPADGTYGNMSPGMFPGPGYADWDFSIFKNMKIKERLSAQFRAEFFNILNHPIIASPDGNPKDTTATGFGCACTTPDQHSTNPYLGTGAAREIQLGLKLLF